MPRSAAADGNPDVWTVLLIQILSILKSSRFAALSVTGDLTNSGNQFFFYYETCFLESPNCRWRRFAALAEKVGMGLELGERLRLRARELGLSDAEVARRLDLSQSRYAHYVSGVREPDFATFARICRALSFSPNQALGFEQRHEEPTEVQRLRERVEAAVQVMDLPVLRKAAAILDVLARRTDDEAVS